MSKLNRVDLTLLPQFNLSLIQSKAHNKSALDPLNWLQSTECAEIKKKMTGQRHKHYFMLYLDTDSNHYYTHGFWVYIGYLRHCVGDSLAAAILTKLSL